jgi:hypothetical protein
LRWRGDLALPGAMAYGNWRRKDTWRWTRPIRAAELFAARAVGPGHHLRVVYVVHPPGRGLKEGRA